MIGAMLAGLLIVWFVWQIILIIQLWRDRP